MHFGPDPTAVGGIGSVMATLRDHAVGGRVVLRPTCMPGSSAQQAGLMAAAFGTIARLETHAIAHVHLSQRGSFLREGLVLNAARARGLAAVASIHGSGFDAFAARRPALVRAVLAHASAITCLTTSTRRHLQRLLPGREISLIANPAIVDAGAPAADTTPELVLFAGEIGVRKGVDVLIRAWEQIVRERPQATCVLVGPATDLQIPQLAGLEVRPPADRTTVRELIRSARVVALPTRAEALPMVLLEALGAARPFVSTPVGEIPTLAAGGTLVPVGDVEQTATALRAYLADPHLARVTGERGLAACVRPRTVDVLDRELRALYERASA